MSNKKIGTNKWGRIQDMGGDIQRKLCAGFSRQFGKEKGCQSYSKVFEKNLEKL